MQSAKRCENPPKNSGEKRFPHLALERIYKQHSARFSHLTPMINTSFRTCPPQRLFKNPLINTSSSTKCENTGAKTIFGML